MCPSLPDVSYPLQPPSKLPFVLQVKLRLRSLTGRAAQFPHIPSLFNQPVSQPCTHSSQLGTNDHFGNACIKRGWWQPSCSFCNHPKHLGLHLQAPSSREPDKATSHVLSHPAAADCSLTPTSQPPEASTLWGC